jgi:hypothetical protein
MKNEDTHNESMSLLRNSIFIIFLDQPNRRFWLSASIAYNAINNMGSGVAEPELIKRVA